MKFRRRRIYRSNRPLLQSICHATLPDLSQTLVLDQRLQIKKNLMPLLRIFEARAQAGFRIFDLGEATEESCAIGEFLVAIGVMAFGASGRGEDLLALTRLRTWRGRILGRRSAQRQQDCNREEYNRLPHGH